MLIDAQLVTCCRFGRGEGKGGGKLCGERAGFHLGGIICYFGYYYYYIQAQYPGATVQRRGSIIQAMLLLGLGSLKLAYALGLLEVL